VDDSVVKIIDKNVPQMIRRSRGYVPYPIFLLDVYGDKQIFAAGSDLKAAFCLYKKGNAVISQYFGDLEEKTILDEYIDAVGDLCSLLKIVPDKVVCDMHPNFLSSRFANTLNIPILYVQHHHAHIASVMAEHHLSEKVIGVAFDGTGYGTDGAIWGGEFLVCDGSEFSRVAHLSYTPILGGDQSMRDAKKTATCFLIDAGLDSYRNDQRSTIIKAALENNINTVLSSSIGRLFDVVASILGIADENSYEGECAIKLEKVAVLALRNKLEPVKLSFEVIQQQDSILIDTASVLKQICRLGTDTDNGAVALGFHYAIADAVLEVCEIIRHRQKINTVALSGGVFQNTVLMERVLELLREKTFQVYYNSAVPTNDGGISLGQIYIGLGIRNKR
jgi:hydrogenase maturation protein HypF